MKKRVVIGLSLLAILLLGASLAMAYDVPGEGDPVVSPGLYQGPNFIDENGDGVCDLMGSGAFGNGQAGANFIDENGDGVCDLAGTGEGYGPFGYAHRVCAENFVDEDGDGLCDLIGSGQGFGPHGNGSGTCGGNFIDEDGDGVCDLMGTGQGFGAQGRMNNGQGRGFGRMAQAAANGQ